jgi:hypothetical protein
MKTWCSVVCAFRIEASLLVSTPLKVKAIWVTNCFDSVTRVLICTQDDAASTHAKETRRQ